MHWRAVDRLPGRASLRFGIVVVVGTADVPEVTLTSPTAPGVTHRWTNMWELTNEVSQAHIWAGFHYRFSTKVGKDIGRNIGQHTIKSVMQPENVSLTVLWRFWWTIGRSILGADPNARKEQYTAAASRGGARCGRGCC
jgi:hypothetical protein